MARAALRHEQGYVVNNLDKKILENEPPIGADDENFNWSDPD